MSRVFIAYGLGEGRWHGRRFTQALRAAGYVITTDITQADIFIAHSGGTYADKPLKAPRLTVIINPSYPTAIAYPKLAWQKIRRDFSTLRQAGKTHEFFIKTSWHIFYIFRYFDRTVRMTSAFWRKRFLDTLPKGPITIMQSINDPWHNIEGGPILPKRFVQLALPGEHDNCWLNPNPYIDLIESRYKKETV